MANRCGAAGVMAGVDRVERDNVTIDGLPMVRLRSRALARSMRRRWGLMDELLDPGRHGAFVVMLDSRTALAHVIRDRNAAAAVGTLVAEARGRGQERPRVYHLHGTLVAVVALVEKNGASNLDPRDAELVRRIESLPPTAPTPEEEALAGSADTAIALAAASWRRGAVSDADRWCDHLRRDLPGAAVHIGWSLVAEADDAEEDGSPYPEEDRERDYDAAVRWMEHRAASADPAAVRVSDEIDRLVDGVPDPRKRWRAAMYTALRAYQGAPEPPLRTIPLGPAVLDLGAVEAMLWVVRRHGGAPAVIGWGRHGAVRIVDLASQSRSALRRLLVTSADGQVEVVLDRRASRVSGPDSTLERIRQIVASRRRLWVAYLHPRVWRHALFPSGPILASTFAGWALAAADGEYERGVVPYILAIMAACAVHVLYRLVVLPRRERTWHRDNPEELGGPVRIVDPRR
jgi:hypothetical protein